MKKNQYRLFIAAVILLPIMYFTACSNKGEMNAPTQPNLDSPQFSLVDYTDLQNSLEDATLDNDMTFNGTFISYSFMSWGSMQNTAMMGGNPWLQRFDPSKLLGRILLTLKVTDDQKTKLIGLMKTYHETMLPLVKEFAAANEAILKDAAAKRTVIVNDVKSGKLTREKAAPLLLALNKATRDAITANPASAAIKVKMCAARISLFSGIESVLDKDQLAKWKLLILLIKNPCA